MLYLWNKLVPEKRSLSSELCAVKSANRTQASFLLPEEAGKYRDMDEMSLVLLLKYESPIIPRSNSPRRLDDLFCCYLNASVYSLANADKLWSGVYPYQRLQSSSSLLSPFD